MPMKKVESFLLYCYTYRPDGRKYFGVTSSNPERRARSGYYGRFYGVIEWLGAENFDLEILHEGLTAEQVSELERFYIEKYQTMDPEHGWNTQRGGFSKNGIRMWAVNCKTEEPEIEFTNANNCRDHFGLRNSEFERARNLEPFCGYWLVDTLDYDKERAREQLRFKNFIGRLSEEFQCEVKPYGYVVVKENRITEYYKRKSYTKKKVEKIRDYYNRNYESLG